MSSATTGVYARALARLHVGKLDGARLALRHVKRLRVGVDVSGIVEAARHGFANITGAWNNQPKESSARRQMLMQWTNTIIMCILCLAGLGKQRTVQNLLLKLC